MPLVGRAVVIVLACIAAALAAGALITVAALYPAWSNLTVDSFADSVPGYLFAFGAIFLSPFALLLWLLVVMLAESLAIRVALFYATAGAVVAGLTYLNATEWSSLSLMVDGFARRELEIMAGSGIVAGFTYWLIAGRRAGAWREPSQAQ